MKNDIRYSEFLFLSALQRRDSKFDYIYVNNPDQQKILGLHQQLYLQMIVALAEDGRITFQRQELQFLVGRLRGEISVTFEKPRAFHDFQWTNPREGLHTKLTENQSHQLEITYRGLCRLEDLRELLKRDRILEPFGVLLDIRYFQRDFEEALHRSSDVPVSVLRLDLDNFKKINEDFCHAAGDVVMKSYLETVRDSLGSLGIAYRGRGDEVAAIIIGQEHQLAKQTAEKMRASIETQRCEFGGKELPRVSASIGIATTPPESRGKDLETLADERQIRAKKAGKNRVLAD